MPSLSTTSAWSMTPEYLNPVEANEHVETKTRQARRNFFLLGTS